MMSDIIILCILIIIILIVLIYLAYNKYNFIYITACTIILLWSIFFLVATVHDYDSFKKDYNKYVIETITYRELKNGMKIPLDTTTIKL